MAYLSSRHLLYISFYLISLCLLSHSSCSGELADKGDVEIEANDTLPNKSYSYLALGDSYTIGEGVNADSRWPNQLVRSLEVQNVIIDSLQVIAKTGWTTQNLLNAIEVNQAGTFDLVSLLIGVNNQFQGKPFSQFQLEFDSLLNIAIQLSGPDKRVFVVSIPDYGLTPFGSANSETIAKELDEYNTYKAQRCAELSIPFIDITGISRELGDQPDALASDRLHPSASQYALWVENILPEVVALFED